MGEEVLGNGTGETRQEFAGGSAVHAVAGLADGFLGGEALLLRSGLP